MPSQKRNPRPNKSQPRQKTDSASKAMFGPNAGVIVKIPSQNLNVLPRKLVRNIPYVTTFTINSGSSGVTSATAIIFYLNSIFSPQSTGGHQPYSHDQLATWYGNYIVNKVSWEVTATSTGGAGELFIIYAYGAAAGAPAITGLTSDVVMEKPMIGAICLSPEGNSRVSQFHDIAYPHKIEGITPRQYRDEVAEYGAAFGSNPTRLPTLRFVTASPSGASTVASTLTVTLSYEVEFYSPLVLASS